MPSIALHCIPDLLALHRSYPQRYPFLLQTLGDDTGWDILFAFPQQQIAYSASTPNAPTFLVQLDKSWRAASALNIADAAAAHLPFHGGWFVYCGYELLHELEPSVHRAFGDPAFPQAWLARIPAALLVDRKNAQAWAFAETGHEFCLNAIQDDLTQLGSAPELCLEVADLYEEDPQAFLEGVASIKHYIRQGDVFQVNLARRWQAILAKGNAAALYARLCERNPAPFAGLADFGQWQIISSSPERLLNVLDGTIMTRPIAGTHPRASSSEDDEMVRQALISSAKERAEHIMLVDLERNDLGRICEPGSVRVDELMMVRSYTHVHHIESSVHGRLRSGTTPGEVLRALFPGGTITGCPKIRTMQLIAELEVSPRHAYTGSMGYLNHDGSMDLNILIRTFTLAGNQLSFKAGAGIVADSEPERELAETRAKAKGLLRALDV